MAATHPSSDSPYDFDDQLFRTHFDKLPGPAYIWRRVGDEIVLAAHNIAAGELEKTHASSLIGMTAREVHADRPDILADLERCIADGTVVTREGEFRHMSGEVRRIVATSIPVAHDTVVTHTEDVTERRASERALAEERFRLEQSLIEIGERERNRIGQDLHDGLAQMLTGVKLLVSSLAEQLRAERSTLSTAATQAADLIDDSIRQARELAQGLSPIGSNDSLEDALEQLAEQSSAVFSVECRAACLCRRKPQLGETASTHLYRIAQEAITNAVRHGRASLVELSCWRDQGRLFLQIRDNGAGIPEPLPAGEGLGLRIMRHRATSIGGELTIAPGETGTLVTCTCPLPSLLD